MERLANSKCDFCSAPNPRWCFPTRTFQHEAHILDKIIVAFMHDEWAACDDCAALIHAGSVYALAERGFTFLTLPLLFHKEMLSGVVKMQDEFRRSRLQGPPVLIHDYL